MGDTEASTSTSTSTSPSKYAPTWVQEQRICTPRPMISFMGTGTDSLFSSFVDAPWFILEMLLSHTHKPRWFFDAFCQKNMSLLDFISFMEKSEQKLYFPFSEMPKLSSSLDKLERESLKHSEIISKKNKNENENYDSSDDDNTRHASYNLFEFAWTVSVLPFKKEKDAPGNVSKSIKDSEEKMKHLIGRIKKSSTTDLRESFGFIPVLSCVTQPVYYTLHVNNKPVYVLEVVPSLSDIKQLYAENFKITPKIKLLSCFDDFETTEELEKHGNKSFLKVKHPVKGQNKAKHRLEYKAIKDQIFKDSLCLVTKFEERINSVFFNPGDQDKETRTEFFRRCYTKDAAASDSKDVMTIYLTAPFEFRHKSKLAWNKLSKLVNDWITASQQRDLKYKDAIDSPLVDMILTVFVVELSSPQDLTQDIQCMIPLSITPLLLRETLTSQHFLYPVETVCPLAYFISGQYAACRMISILDKSLVERGVIVDDRNSTMFTKPLRISKEPGAIPEQLKSKIKTLDDAVNNLRYDNSDEVFEAMKQMTLEQVGVSSIKKEKESLIIHPALCNVNDVFSTNIFNLMSTLSGSSEIQEVRDLLSFSISAKLCDCVQDSAHFPWFENDDFHASLSIEEKVDHFLTLIEQDTETTITMLKNALIGDLNGSSSLTMDVYEIDSAAYKTFLCLDDKHSSGAMKLGDDDPLGICIKLDLKINDDTYLDMCLAWCPVVVRLNDDEDEYCTVDILPVFFHNIVFGGQSLSQEGTMNNEQYHAFINNTSNSKTGPVSCADYFSSSGDATLCYDTWKRALVVGMTEQRDQYFSKGLDASTFLKNNDEFLKNALEDTDTYEKFFDMTNCHSIKSMGKVQWSSWTMSESAFPCIDGWSGNLHDHYYAPNNHTLDVFISPRFVLENDDDSENIIVSFEPGVPLACVIEMAIFYKTKIENGDDDAFVYKFDTATQLRDMVNETATKQYAFVPGDIDLYGFFHSIGNYLRDMGKCAQTLLSSLKENGVCILIKDETVGGLSYYLWDTTFDSNEECPLKKHITLIKRSNGGFCMQLASSDKMVHRINKENVKVHWSVTSKSLILNDYRNKDKFKKIIESQNDTSGHLNPPFKQSIKSSLDRLKRVSFVQSIYSSYEISPDYTQDLKIDGNGKILKGKVLTPEEKLKSTKDYVMERVMFPLRVFKPRKDESYYQTSSELSLYCLSGDMTRYWIDVNIEDEDDPKIMYIRRLVMENDDGWIVTNLLQLRLDNDNQ